MGSSLPVAVPDVDKEFCDRLGRSLDADQSVASPPGSCHWPPSGVRRLRTASTQRARRNRCA